MSVRLVTGKIITGIEDGELPAIWRWINCGQEALNVCISWFDQETFAEKGNDVLDALFEDQREIPSQGPRFNAYGGWRSRFGTSRRSWKSACVEDRHWAVFVPGDALFDEVAKGVEDGGLGKRLASAGLGPALQIFPKQQRNKFRVF